jgi:hypothetical protein
MALLDKAREPVIVYPEIEDQDDLGNIILRAADVGYVAMATIQPARQSGTSARRAEQDNEGYETEENYRLRFTRKHDRERGMLGQGSEIEWRGQRWYIVGKPTIYNGSRRTAHIDYSIRRS